MPINRDPIRDSQSERRLFGRRALLAGAGVLAAFGLLGGRLGQLQVAEHQRFVTLAQANRMKLIPVPPNRGLIHDRNGVVLAQNRPTFQLTLTPERIPDIDQTLRGLAQLVTLTPDDLDRFQGLLRRSRRFHALALKHRLSETEVAAFAAHRHRFPGVEVEARLTRHYPHGNHAAHALGYVGRIDEQELARLDRSRYAGTNHIGKTGVELGFEERLQGFAGLSRVETNALGRIIQPLERIDPSPGEDIFLTIDSRLQQAAEEALGSETGSVVVLDVERGDVLALASTPGFDPNAFVHGIDASTYASLQNNPERPLFNRAIAGRYPPGSTIKPFLALAGLHHGIRTPSDRVFCSGTFRLPRVSRPWRCWQRRGHGWMNMRSAVAQSCDVYFYDLAHRLGIDTIAEFLDGFGFGLETGLDLPGESRGILPSRSWKRDQLGRSWYPGETVITGIGQGYFLITPLQLACATATLARRGVQVQPRLLLSSQSARSVPTKVVDLASEEHWEQAIAFMEASVHDEMATARLIRDGLDYRLAGKTGTSQVFTLPPTDEVPDQESLERKLRDHGLFNCFFPAQAPRFAVAVVVEHGGGGASAAAPVARRVSDACMDLFPDDPSNGQAAGAVV